MQTIKQIRKKIKETDALIIKKIAERQVLSKKIGLLKRQEGMNIIDLTQEDKNFQHYEKLCLKYQLQLSFIQQLFIIIISHSKKAQETSKAHSLCANDNETGLRQVT